MTYIEDLLHDRYYQPGESSWADLTDRVIGYVYEGAGEKERDAAHKALLNREFIPSSPVLMNAGTRYPMMISCFVLPVHDNIQSIMETLSNTVFIQKFGGGVGINFSEIRPEGSVIKSTNGVASGPVSFMGFWNTGMNVIRQGGKRQGAMMGILGVDHPDLPLFLNAKQQEGELTNFNLSIMLPGEFWDRPDRDARLREIAEHTWANGEPGVLFHDNINAERSYGGLEINATNPCWAGDTKVWTAHGPRRFDELAAKGKDVNVLTETDSGRLVFRTMRKPRKTGEKRLWEIGLNNGTTLRTTGNHIVILKGGMEVRVENLKPGARLSSVYRYKANSKGYLRLSNGTEDPLEHHVAVELSAGRRPDYPYEHCHHIDGNQANNVPENLQIIPAAEHNRMKMIGKDNPMFGVWDERNPLYGYDVAGENNPRYRDDVTVEKVKTFKEQGLTHEEVALRLGCSVHTVKARWKLAKTAANHVVVSVTQTDSIAPVYDGTVDETHTYFVMAGDNDAILSHNCGEVPLPPYGACCLGSINLTAALKYDEPRNRYDLSPSKLRILVNVGVEFLNRVLDRNWWPVDEIEAFENRYRPIGLGVMGLADVLASLRIPYGSSGAQAYVRHLMSTIRYLAEQAAERYAKQYDKPHNATLFSIAPTGSISMLAGCSYSIEPYFTFTGQKHVEAGEFDIDSSIVERVAHLFGEEVTKGDWDIIAETGSVANTGLSYEAKDVLKTANEIPWQDHIRMQAAVQQYVDSAVSKTINMPNSATVDDVVQAITMAWAHGCKGLTIYRNGSRRDEVIAGTGGVNEDGFLECDICEI